MKVLEQFLKPTQNKLFKMLCKMFGSKVEVKRDKHFILVRGDVPVMLLAHLDTVHKEPVRDICKSKDRNILMSPQGIGGDDRCGVYALVNAYELSVKKPWLLFTCDEEIGGIGAKYFCNVHQEGDLPKEIDDMKMLIEIDRRGKNDAVYYDCDNKEFERYISGKGFKTAWGSFSDISVIAPELGVAAVNLSSAYYNAHQISEYINRAELDNVLIKVVEIISEVAKKDFPKYEYVERSVEFYDYDWRYMSNGEFRKKSTTKIKYLDDEDDEYDDIIPKRLPTAYQELYDALIEEEIYTVEELEALRDAYGDSVVYEIYVDEFGPFYNKAEDGSTVTAIDYK